MLGTVVGPIQSVYWWRGTLRTEQEWQLIMMSTGALFDALESHIKANHTYETPEIIATEIATGSAEYLQWITDETRRTGVSS